MTTTTEVAQHPVAPVTDTVHLTCGYPACNPDVAYCGLDVSDHVYDNDTDKVCVVCYDLRRRPCPLCGQTNVFWGLA